MEDADEIDLSGKFIVVAIFKLIHIFCLVFEYITLPSGGRLTSGSNFTYNDCLFNVEGS